MFDLDLIERALDASAAATANRGSGKTTAERARAEFAKLRHVIDGAPSAKVARVSEYYARGKACSMYVGNLPIDWRGHRVLLVKCDE